MKKITLLTLAGFVVLLVSTCESKIELQGVSSGGDGDTDGDNDSDSDGDSDSDSDGDSDGDASEEDTDTCDVSDDNLNGIAIEVKDKELPDTFEPVIQWSWKEGDASMMTPLVANLTDDNGDGKIDLCDTPDVVVVTIQDSYQFYNGYICVLDGATGKLHFRIKTLVNHSITPAIGDIDNDGLVEIVTFSVKSRNLIAFENTGEIKWTSDFIFNPYGDAVALADLDNDGDVEILLGNAVFDHTGKLLWRAPEDAGPWSATTAADLDGDGDLEVILGGAAYHHDGSEYYNLPKNEKDEPFYFHGYPQVADLVGDKKPEILLTTGNGITLLSNTGEIIYSNKRPTNLSKGKINWTRAAAIHDFDGDGKAEFALCSSDQQNSQYTVYEADASIIWSTKVQDFSGIATGTAFDFIGSGKAQAMYGDENNMFIFDGAGKVLLKSPRSSGTMSEYPVVADVDNDGHAEIIITSKSGVQVIRDKKDRWVGARRIWNQHTYHVTNVREDGTIPQFEPPNWEFLNTFRTQAQISSIGEIEKPIAVE